MLPLLGIARNAARDADELQRAVNTMADDRDQQPSYQTFRRRLDDVLRTRDPASLRAFLLAEGQWRPEQQTDDEAAMWMMIAASPALAEMHDEAERWLMSHGHAPEARAILGPGRQGQHEPPRPTQRPDDTQRRRIKSPSRHGTSRPPAGRRGTRHRPPPGR